VSDFLNVSRNLRHCQSYFWSASQLIIGLETILTHESFNDMLGIVRDTPSTNNYAATNVLDILAELFSNRQCYCQKRLDEIKLTARLYYDMRREAERLEAELANLKGLIIGLYVHRQALCDFLVYRAAHSDILDEKWTWKEGDAIPKIAKKQSITSSFFKDELTIPPEFLCPVSQEIMEDPVKTCDGFTFDRKNIER